MTKIREEQHPLLLEMLAQDMTLEQMGAALGVNYGTVRLYCIRHNLPRNQKRGWRFGSNQGEKHHSWNGGRSVSPDGYVWMMAKDHPNANKMGYVREHRLVMEAALGRYLERGEVVHHRDGDKSNNAIENLELFESNAAHMSRSHRGMKRTAEQKARMSVASKGRKMPAWTEERRRQQSLQRKGTKLSDEARAKISEAARRRQQKISPEQRLAMVAGRRRNGQPWHSEEAKRSIAEGHKRLHRQRRDQISASSPEVLKTDDLPLR